MLETTLPKYEDYENYSNPFSRNLFFSYEKDLILFLWVLHKELDLTTAGDWDCVAAVERLPVLHYSVDFIFLSFGIMGFIVEL